MQYSKITKIIIRYLVSGGIPYFLAQKLKSGIGRIKRMISLQRVLKIHN